MLHVLAELSSEHPLLKTEKKNINVQYIYNNGRSLKKSHQWQSYIYIYINETEEK